MNPIALALQKENSQSDKLVISHNYQKSSEQTEHFIVGCTVNDCVNGGICYRANDKSDTNETKCKCQLGYGGDKCELLKTVQYKYEDSYLEFESPDLFDGRLRVSYDIGNVVSSSALLTNTQINDSKLN